MNRAHLQRHKRTAHDKTPKEPIACTNDDCPAYFDSIAKLKNHLLKVHNGVQREFVCDLCDEKFARKSKLRQHMFTHTGYFNYRCSVCEKGFVQLSHLKRHEKIHSSRVCDQCSEGFPNWSSLMAHKRDVHSTEETNRCIDCDKMFRNKRTLKNHRKMHVKESEERLVYKCTFANCPRFFSNQSNLLTHYKSAHENKKYACTVDGCGRELTTKQSMNNHIRVMHSLDSEGKPVAKTKKSSKTNRAKRKDTGAQKVSLASKMFEMLLPKEFEQAIMAGDGNKITFHYDPSSVDPDDTDMDESSACVEKTMTEGITKNRDAIKCCN